MCRAVPVRGFAEEVEAALDPAEDLGLRTSSSGPAARIWNLAAPLAFSHGVITSRGDAGASLLIRKGIKGMRFRSVIMLSAAAVVLSLVSSTSISMASECCSTIQARLLPPYSPRIVHDEDTRLRKVLCDIHRDPGYGRCIKACEQIDDNGAKDDCWYSCNVQFGCGRH
jgi:hypothetical protein